MPDQNENKGEFDKVNPQAAETLSDRILTLLKDRGALKATEIAMKRPHPDPRNYNCTPRDNHGRTACRGKMIVIGYKFIGNKQAVYVCPVCKRKAGEASLLYAYNQLRKVRKCKSEWST